MKSCVLLSTPIRYHSRVTRSVRALAKLGEVTLFHIDPTQADRSLFGSLYGDRVRLHPVAAPDRKPSWIRKNVLIHRDFDFLAEAAIATGEPFDLVLANDLPTLNGAVRLAQARDAALVYDSMDLYVETINQFFPDDATFPRSLAFAAVVRIVRRVQRRVERRLIGDVDHVITASEGYAEYLERNYRPRDCTVVLNCPDLPDDAFPVDIHAELGIPAGDRVVLYQGLLNAGRGLRNLVSSAKFLPKGHTVVLLGFGVLEEKLREIVRRESTGDRVLIVPPVEQSELPAWTAAVDLGVLLLEPFNVSKRLSSATKIYEYMAAGIPVLTTDLPGNRVVRDEEAGWLIDDLEPQAVARAIEAALADDRESRRRGANGRAGAEREYHWARQEERFLGAVRSALEGGAPAPRRR